MADDGENVSAYSVYSAQAAQSRGQRNKRNRKPTNIIEISLSKADKLDLIKKKKEKKNKVLKKVSFNDYDNISPNKPGNVKNISKAEKKMLLKMKKPRLTEKPFKKKKLLKNENNKTTKSNTKEGSSTDSSPEILKSDSSPNSVSDGSPKKQKRKALKSTAAKVINKDNTPVKKRKKKIQITKEARELEEFLMSLANHSSKEAKSRENGSKSTSRKSPENEKSSNQFLSRIDAVEEEEEEEKNEIVSAETATKSALSKKNRKGSSETCGKLALEKILHPYNLDLFLEDCWEKYPLHIKGSQVHKFSTIISCEMIDATLRENTVLFGKHLDVTSYTHGKRETHNMDGRAHAHIVWDFYSNGCSVRLLNPQYFMSSVHTLNSSLQEYFGCFVGANVYLTPPQSQGFAPHYDDIEAFILQVEGSKLWKIYSPIDKDSYLPRYSSRNLTEEEIGDPIMEVKLSAGDVLYFPRGFIHQGRTESEHSLHITLSVYQRTAWCDLLEKLLPLSLKKAASKNVEFRKGLPLGYLKSGGRAYKDSEIGKEVITKLRNLVTKLADYLETDDAIDEMGLSFIQDALPPVLNQEEAERSVLGGGLKMEKNGKLINETLFTPNTRVRWIREYCYRILEEDVGQEDGTIERQTRVYHTLDNSREYHKEDPQFVIIPPGMVPDVLQLVTAYPAFTKLSDLCGESSIDEKIALVSDLWDCGLLMTSSPLYEKKGEEEEETTSDSDDSSSDSEPETNSVIRRKKLITNTEISDDSTSESDD